MISGNLSNQAFLEELYQQWNKNPVVATLNARLHPMDIPLEVIQIAGDLQQRSIEWSRSVAETQHMNDAINAQLGSIGIFGGSSSFGSGLGVGWNTPNANELMFYGTMAKIRSSQDNPQPVPPGLVSQSAAILRGQIDPMQVYILMSSQVPGYGQLSQGLWQMLGSMLGGLPPFFKQLALILAALSVPQYQIAELLADPTLQNPQRNDLSRLLNVFSNIFHQ